MSGVVSPPPTRVTALARRLVRTVTDRTRVALADAGFPDVRPVHNLVFAQIEAGGVRITDMAERSGITKQAVTLMVDHLEAGGYVTRVADATDRRAKLVELTDRGRAAADASRRAAEQIESVWASRLGGDRLAALKGTLGDLIAAVEASGPPDSTGGSPGRAPGSRGRAG